MRENNIWYKIWRIIYPLIMYFLLDVIAVWLVETLLLAWAPIAGGTDSWLVTNIPSIATIVFLAASIPIFYKLFKNDYNPRSDYIFRKPWYLGLILLMGALASHGFSALISLINIDGIIGSYTQIEESVYSANVILVILQTVILAPVSEEFLFRGILYRRMEKYFGSYWVPALISSALFGIYHFNLAQGIFSFFIGMLSCAIYYQVRNLAASMLFHMGANALSAAFTYLGFNYPKMWLYVIGMTAALAFAWAIYYFLIRPIGQETTDYR